MTKKVEKPKKPIVTRPKTTTSLLTLSRDINIEKKKK